MFDSRIAQFNGKSIGIYNGSFDPPHLGHKEVLKKSLERVDCVVVISNNINPYKPLRTDAKIRKLMLETLFKNNKPILISSYSESEAFTRLKSLCPNSTFKGIMGSDGALHYGKKKQPPKHFKDVESWLVFVRDSDKEKEMPKAFGNKKVTLIRDGLSHQNCSSTSIRDFCLKHSELFESGQSDNHILPVSKEIFEFIRTNKLYYLPNEKIISIINQSFSGEIEQLTQGYSGDRVFKVPSSNLIIKAIIGSDAKARSQTEKTGMDQLRSLEIPHLTSPKVLSLDHHEGFSLIQMTLAEGVSLNELMRKGKNDKVQFKEALISAETIGGVVARLHSLTKKAIQNLDQTDWSRYIEDIEWTIHLLQKNSEVFNHLNIPTFIEKIDSLKTAMEKEPGLSCMNHGDSNPANWFVEGSLVTAIDCGAVNAYGFAAKEYYEFLSVFPLVGNRYNLSVDQIRSLQKSFKNGYTQVKKVFPNETSTEFFRLYWRCRGINFNSKFLINPKKKYSSDEVAKAKSTLKVIIDGINQELIGNYKSID